MAANSCRTLITVTFLASISFSSHTWAGCGGAGSISVNWDSNMAGVGGTTFKVGQALDKYVVSSLSSFGTRTSSAMSSALQVVGSITGILITVAEFLGEDETRAKQHLKGVDTIVEANVRNQATTTVKSIPATARPTTEEDKQAYYDMLGI